MSYKTDVAWKDWNEVNQLTRGRGVVLYGRSEDWLPKTLKKLEQKPVFIVDSNKKYDCTQYNDINVFLPDALFKSNDKPYVIITSSIYDEIASILESKDFHRGVDFCYCPEYKDYAHLERLKNYSKDIVIASSDYLDSSRARSSKAGGGIFVYNTKDCSYEKKLDGVYRQIVRNQDVIYAVEYVKGEIHILDLDFKITAIIDLDGANYCGISYDLKYDQLVVVNAAKDMITIYDANTLLIKKVVYFSDKSKQGASSAHHLNDCCCYDGKVYVTFFSETGNWKLGLFDGGVAEYDLEKLNNNFTVLYRNAWMPHSPVVINDNLCFLDSMRGNLISSNQHIVTHFDYFARGLAHDGEFYYIGASENMYATRLKKSEKVNNIMVNSGFSIFDSEANLSRFFPLMHNMNVHDLMIL